MQRWDWSVARAYLPTALALATAFLASLRVPAVQAGAMRAGPAADWDWAAYLLFALACLLGTAATLRLWRRRQTAGLLCRCGGLLGPEKMGRKGVRATVCRACGREWRRRA
ncbi:hypothetical protein ACWKWK_04985 [Pseudoxanthomonas beigongshangi]